MKYVKKVIGKFFIGFTSFCIFKPHNYSVFPFAYPSKAVTNDWIMVGEDLRNYINK